MNDAAFCRQDINNLNAIKYEVEKLTFINRLFSGVNTRTKLCLGCKHVVETKMDFFYMNLDLIMTEELKAKNQHHCERNSKKYAHKVRPLVKVQDSLDR